MKMIQTRTEHLLQVLHDLADRGAYPSKQSPILLSGLSDCCGRERPRRIKRALWWPSTFFTRLDFLGRLDSIVVVVLLLALLNNEWCPYTASHWALVSGPDRRRSCLRRLSSLITALVMFSQNDTTYDKCFAVRKKRHSTRGSANLQSA